MIRDMIDPLFTGLGALATTLPDEGAATGQELAWGLSRGEVVLVAVGSVLTLATIVLFAVILRAAFREERAAAAEVAGKGADADRPPGGAGAPDASDR